MSRFIRRPVVLLLSAALIATGLAQAGVFAEGNRDVEYSHLGSTPLPDCRFNESSPSAMATPISPAATPQSLQNIDFRIQGTAANDETTGIGLPDPLRLYTVRLPADADLSSELGTGECEPGYILIYVVSGEVEFAHLASPDGAGIDQSGKVSYVASPATTSAELPVGAPPVTLRAGDSIFLEHAVFSFRRVGESEALLLVSAVTPFWLPCHGGGCG